MTRGGLRTPANPAVVSGPGALSQRTDGAPHQVKTYIPGDPTKWGDAKDLNSVAGAAPLAASPGTPPGPPIAPPAAGPGAATAQQGGASQTPQQLTPMNAPTTRPDEPLTAGAPFGPGDGPQAGPAPQDLVATAVRMAYARLPSPQLSSLVSQLESQGR